MKTEITSILVACFFLTAVSPRAHAQQEVFIPNAGIGLVLDTKASSRFEPGMSDFGGPSVASNAQGTNRDEPFVVDTLVQVEGDTIARDQQGGAGTPSVVLSNTPPQTPSDILPFARDGKKDLGESYPRFGFGVGISTFPLNLDGLQSILNSIEARYGQMGYPVSHNTADLSSNGSHPWFILSVRFSRTIGTLLEFGSSGKDEINNASALIATVLYYPQFRSFHWLKPYIGAGIGICSYSPNQSFYYGNRVSPIDPTNGSYKYLASVNFVGGESNACASLQGGIAVEQESKLTRLSFHVYATCLLAPAFEIRASGGESSTVGFGKVQLGGRLLIYL